MASSSGGSWKRTCKAILVAYLTVAAPGCITLGTKTNQLKSITSSAGALLLVAGDALVALGPSRVHGALDDQPGDFRWYWPWVLITLLGDAALAVSLAGH